ncbi:hypothetical protein GO001_14360 [Streptomyces sp. NRRL B-1677]|uniref:hypothetical protein n=1 Tax=Streptomyces TaxID=1883 RepID=UPI001892941F|nr:hypothetical protein [Streptomyces sp. NRRL B-1677]MBF6046394.1 hypothetical protein [Streptomyces sp. NRRL B-1677]
MTALRHRLYRRLHPRRYRAGRLAEQRHQFLDLDPHLIRDDYTRPAVITEAVLASLPVPAENGAGVGES